MIRASVAKSAPAVLAACFSLAMATGTASAAPQEGTNDFDLTWGKDKSGKPTLRIEAGQCVGNFHDPRVVNGKMEWGADTHCSGTGWYPHHLSLTLEQKEVVDWWFDFFHPVAWTNSTPQQSGSPDISLHEHWRPCDDVGNTDYRIIAKLTAGTHNTVAISEEHTVDCVYDSTL